MTFFGDILAMLQRRQIRRFEFVFFAWALLSWGRPVAGQEVPPSAPPTYLLLMDRYQNARYACVLVQRDGQYHMELRLPEKPGFYEGRLPEKELRELVGILSDDRLLHLTQKDIRSPFAENGRDALRMAIFRDSGRQDLYFPSPGFAFTDKVGPLMEWFDRLQKRKGKKLSEDVGRNNCAIPGARDIRLSERPGKDQPN